MSEDTPNTVDDSSVQDDTIKNLKAEMARKLENINKANEQLTQQNQILSQKLEQVVDQISVKEKLAQEEDLEDLRYTDPDAYIEKKLADVDKKVEEKVNTVTQTQQRQQQVLTNLANDYPEINDENSELYKTAISMANNYNADFVSTPEGMELLVNKAASKLGLLPSSKRADKQEQTEEVDMDEFIGGGSSGSGKKPPKKKSSELDPKTIVAAKLMGLDTDDPKVIESLKKRSGRKNYNRWE